MNISIACTAALILLSWHVAAGEPDQSTAVVPAAPAEAGTPAPSMQAASAPRTVVLRANALLPLRFAESVGSDTHHPGNTFRMEVTDDIMVDDLVVIPAGSIAAGEVIHAQPAGMLGKAGELIVSARYVLVGEREIRLRSALGSAGKGNLAGAFFVPFVRGKQASIPENTEVVAKIASDESFEGTEPQAR